MHPELNMHIARLRFEELSATRRHPEAPASARRSLRSILRRRPELHGNTRLNGCSYPPFTSTRL